MGPNIPATQATMNSRLGVAVNASGVNTTPPCASNPAYGAVPPHGLAMREVGWGADELEALADPDHRRSE
jgi:hypothetical protein